MFKNKHISVSNLFSQKSWRFFTFLVVGFIFFISIRSMNHASYGGQTTIYIDQEFNPTGWIGDKKSLYLNTKATDTFHSLPDSIRVEYHPAEGKWAGLYWQTPPENWGSESGIDLSGATKLTFWARGAEGGEVVEFMAGGINSPGLVYKDSFHASTQKIELTKTWKQYSINLEGHNLSNVIGGFAFVITSHWLKSGKIIFYIDDIRYEWKYKKWDDKLSINITNPNNDGTEVRRSLVVEGTASIPSGTHLWVLVRREDFEGLWWPQGEGIIDPISKKWKVPVQFGIPDDIGWHFDLVAIVVDNSQHAILRNYRIIAMKTGDWRPIEIPKVLASPTMRSVIKVGH